MFVQLCILLPIMLLVQAAAATEVDTADFSQKATDHVNMHIDHVKQLLLNPITEGHRKLPSGFRYDKILGYYQLEMYFSGNQGTCDKGGEAVPKVAAGVAFGCVDFSSNGVAGIGAYGLTCQKTDEGIKIGAQFYKSSDCTGGTTTMSGMSASPFDLPEMKCTASIPMSYDCAGPILPASLFNGYRTVTYLESDVCMGPVYTYANVYGNDYVCANGEVKRGSSIWKNSCISVNVLPSWPMSMSTGCISKMGSITTRSFLKWDMTQTLVGINSVNWSGSSKNTIALLTTLAQIYGIDYNTFTDIKVNAISSSDASAEVGVGGASDSVEVVYTIMIQPGFGNSYTKDNVYANIKAIHESKVSSDCTTNGCFKSILSAVATDMDVSDLSGVTSGTFGGASSPVTTNGQDQPGGGGQPPGQPSGQPPGPKDSAGGGVAGIVVGIVLALVIIGAAGYYKFVYLPKQQAAMAAATITLKDDAQTPSPRTAPSTVNPLQTA